MEFKLPDVSVLKDVHMQVPLRVYSSDGKLIAQYGAKRRIPVAFDQIPKPLVQAVLATEDARYYSHPGVDFIGLVRAVIAVVSSGRKVQGASTITMQVARNFFLTRKKTYTRKINEILLALKIDRTLSKQKVLELYLNKVYFGNRAYGVAAAARVYYGKKLKALTLPQMAMIAGLPQAPSKNNPLRNKKAALLRRNHVLRRMLEVGFIDKKTYLQAIKAPITAKYHEESVALNAPYVAEMVRQVMVDAYGNAAYDAGFKVTTTISAKLQNAARYDLQQGLLAYSKRHGFVKPRINLGTPSAKNEVKWQTFLEKQPSVDDLTPAVILTVSDHQAVALLANRLQVTIPWAGLSFARPALAHGYVGKLPKTAQQILTPGDVVYLQFNNKDQYWMLSQVPKVQGALVSLNPQTGAILAIRGGFSFALSHFNRAFQAFRQPGSAFKPFIYTAALAKDYTLATLINDAPVVLKDSGENSLWRPQNDNFKFYGPTRLRVGLTKSRNLVSIRILQAIGIPYALSFIKKFGLDTDKLPHTLSLALGSGVVTPLKIAAGYAVIANGGYQVKPYFIQRIEGQKGQIIYQANPLVAPKVANQKDELVVDKKINLAPQVLSSQTAFLMTQALHGVIQHGTGRAARVLHRNDLAGKTGTTNNQVDAWFSGFNSDVLTTVWVGFDDSSQSLHEYGSGAALPIWIKFMRTALDGTKTATLPEPSGIVTVRIDPKTGLLARPEQKNALFEVFRKSLVPKQYADNSSEEAPSHSIDRGNDHTDEGDDTHIF